MSTFLTATQWRNGNEIRCHYHGTGRSDEKKERRFNGHPHRWWIINDFNEPGWLNKKGKKDLRETVCFKRNKDHRCKYSAVTRTVFNRATVDPARAFFPSLAVANSRCKREQPCPVKSVDTRQRRKQDVGDVRRETWRRRPIVSPLAVELTRQNAWKSFGPEAKNRRISTMGDVDGNVTGGWMTRQTTAWVINRSFSPSLSLSLSLSLCFSFRVSNRRDRFNTGESSLSRESPAIQTRDSERSSKQTPIIQLPTTNIFLLLFSLQSLSFFSVSFLLSLLACLFNDGAFPRD